VIRGEDHISNTPRQLLLYEALGCQPPLFAHLSLVLGPDHAPLSKRHGATSVAEFRARGYLPDALVNYLALLGWSPRGGASDGTELMPPAELARRFALEDVTLSAAVFDEDKLAWVNRHYLKAAPASRLAELSIPWFARAGIHLAPDARGLAFLAGVMPIASASVDRLEQVPARLAFLFDYDAARALRDDAVRREMSAPAARAVAQALAQVLGEMPRLVDRERFRAAADEVRRHTGQKGRGLFHPVRIVLTGRPEGPELDLAVPAIERGAELPPGAGLPPIAGARERASAFVRELDRLPGSTEDVPRRGV
jgi:glutamyl-tRNA synthetase/nondiscriminating glutamyl-tRNA synthetase